MPVLRRGLQQGPGPRAARKRTRSRRGISRCPSCVIRALRRARGPAPLWASPSSFWPLTGISGQRCWPSFAAPTTGISCRRTHKCPPRTLHLCWVNCFTLTLKNGLYVRADGSDETWTIERFTTQSVVLHRHDAAADWNGFRTDVTYAGQVFNDQMTGVTVDGKPGNNIRVAWGSALNTLPANNAERDQHSSAPVTAPVTPVASHAAPAMPLQSDVLLATAADTVTEEPRIVALAGNPSGVTVTMNGHGGPCVYSGKGYYSVKPDGELSVQVMEDCGGVNNRGALIICPLSAALDCGPTALFPHHLPADRRWPDGRRAAAFLGSHDRIEYCRSAACAAESDVRGSESGTCSERHQQSGPRASALWMSNARRPKGSFRVGATMRLVSQMPQRPDLDKLRCIDNELQPFLAGAKLGDAVNAGSALGSCLQSAFPSTNWAITRCEVVGP
jgi:hypothetical protein